jgi:serine/threonine protein kinase
MVIHSVHHPNLAEVAVAELEGEHLAARFSSRGLTLDETRHILAQCASALDACHGAGISHGDFKLENIFLSRLGSDECFVKVIGVADSGPASADIYSLGVVMYELFTGKAPDPRSPVAPRVTNPKLPLQLQAICGRAMAKDRGFATMRELERALDDPDSCFSQPEVSSYRMRSTTLRVRPTAHGAEVTTERLRRRRFRVSWW